MPSFPVEAGYRKRFALILLLALGASGCKPSRFHKKIESFTCEDQTVDVNVNNGAQPQVVYICEDNTVTWKANGHQFLVEFQQDSPFKDKGKKFDHQHAHSAGGIHLTEPTVFKYQITVDGTHVFDPHVIGGGGTP